MTENASGPAAEQGSHDPHRRRLLLKIGMAGLAVYAAPLVLNLAGEARASDDRSDDGVGGGRSDGRTDDRAGDGRRSDRRDGDRRNPEL